MFNKFLSPPPGSRLAVALRAALVLLLVISCNASTLAFAADNFGRIEGTITDQTGAGIAASRVVLRDAVGAAVAQSSTDHQGHFAFRLREGRYLLTVEAKGFSQTEKLFVEVRANETKRADVEMAVAAVSDQIVVSATRTATSSNEVAGAVAVISEDDFKRNSDSQISEALRLVPGLAVVQTGGRGGLTSIFTRGGESDYNKVLIDGVPVNAAGGAFDFATLTPENLERVEVARGPQSALFGSDAMTSVIQLFTRRGATATPELELSGDGGSFASHRETAIFSGLARWFDYSSSYAYQHTDGRFRNSDYTNRSASLNLGFKLAPQADLRVTSRLNNNTLGVPGATARLFADPTQRQKHHDLSLAAQFRHRTTARWEQTARFILAEFQTHSFDTAAEDLSKPNTPLLAPGSFGNDFVFSFIDHQKRAGFQYQTIAALSSANLLTAGVDFEHESAVFTGDFSRVSPKRNNLGLYVQDQHAWRERLFVTAGVRVERNTGRTPADLRAALQSLGSTAPIGDIGFGSKANPKVALAYFARRHQEGGFGATRLKASFGTGIKEPSLTEAFSPSTFFLGNPGLKPERAISFEVGVAQEFFNRRGSVEATYFDNRFRDQIIFIYDPKTFGPVKLADGKLTNFVNVERATARGLELIAAARPALKLRVAASYTFLRSRLERADATSKEVGLPLLRRPRHSGSFEIGWIDNRFEVSLDGSLVGRRRDLDPVSGARFNAAKQAIFNDGYAKLNAAGSYHFSPRVTAFARLENLLNQDYQEVLGFPAYRLNFRAGLRLRIGGDR
ncbi:MAG: TonB-dependent receptor [Acidobacteria bacterium]|nr:TonB-dependent receptor [Acidobacteriota bacterium]